MDKDVLIEITALWDKINDISKQLSDFADMLNAERKADIEAITPYTETKQAYVGDTSVTFTDTPQGNLTVYFPYPYTVERMADRITVSFEELEEVTEITISIL